MTAPQGAEAVGFDNVILTMILLQESRIAQLEARQIVREALFI